MGCGREHGEVKSIYSTGRSKVTVVLFCFCFVFCLFVAVVVVVVVVVCVCVFFFMFCPVRHLIVVFAESCLAL